MVNSMDMTKIKVPLSSKTTGNKERIFHPTLNVNSINKMKSSEAIFEHKKLSDKENMKLQKLHVPIAKFGMNPEADTINNCSLNRSQNCVIINKSVHDVYPPENNSH